MSGTGLEGRGVVVGTKAHGPRVIGNGAVLPVDHGWSAV